MHAPHARCAHASCCSACAQAFQEQLRDGHVDFLENGSVRLSMPLALSPTPHTHPNPNPESDAKPKSKPSPGPLLDAAHPPHRALPAPGACRSHRDCGGRGAAALPQASAPVAAAGRGAARLGGRVGRAARGRGLATHRHPSGRAAPCGKPPASGLGQCALKPARPATGRSS